MPVARPCPARRALAILLLTLASCAPAEAPGREGRSPNLLLIAVDTLRADHLGTYGYQRPTSPAIDRLFASAVSFDAAQSTSSWTLPAFASLMTSLYSSTHGCWQFTSRLESSFTTLAEVLRDSGYHTAAVVSHTFLGFGHGLRQGFEDYDDSLVHVSKQSQQQISSPAVTGKAIAFLEGQVDAEKPWFLWIHFFDPHAAYQHHKESPFGGNKLIDLYDGEIAYTDRHIGQILHRLENLGLADDTVVGFVVDHGEEFGDHQRLGHGKTLYREITRVPYAIRAPGFAPRRVAAPVSGVDFMPTILDLLDVPAPGTPMAGRSLVPAMRGEAMEDRGVLLESRLLSLRKANLKAFVHGRWKLILEKPLPVSEAEPPVCLLFDRESDIGEERDVFAERPEIVAQMMAQMTEAADAAKVLAEHFTVAEDLVLSAEEMERLRSLGYVGVDDQQGTPRER